MNYEEYKELSERVIEVKLLDEDIVKEFNYDSEWGFAWIEIQGKDEDVVVQACMTVENDELLLKINECGHLEGCCGDANEKAFELHGEERCMQTLFHYAKENGIIVF